MRRTTHHEQVRQQARGQPRGDRMKRIDFRVIAGRVTTGKYSDTSLSLSPLYGVCRIVQDLRRRRRSSRVVSDPPLDGLVHRHGAPPMAEHTWRSGVRLDDLFAGRALDQSDALFTTRRTSLVHLVLVPQSHGLQVYRTTKEFNRPCALLLRPRVLAPHQRRRELLTV